MSHVTHTNESRHIYDVTPAPRHHTAGIISYTCYSNTQCNALQHTATHCNTLQHTATLRYTRHHTAGISSYTCDNDTHCNTLQVCCSVCTLQVCCSVLHCEAVCFSVFQYVAVGNAACCALVYAHTHTHTHTHIHR